MQFLDSAKRLRRRAATNSYQRAGENPKKGNEQAVKKQSKPPRNLRTAEAQENPCTLFPSRRPSRKGRNPRLVLPWDCTPCIPTRRHLDFLHADIGYRCAEMHLVRSK